VFHLKIVIVSTGVEHNFWKGILLAELAILLHVKLDRIFGQLF